MQEDPFIRKGYGRIFVFQEEDVPKVLEIIDELDSFEFTYLIPGMVAVFDPEKEVDRQLIFTHKFEIDMNALTLTCLKRGIRVFCYSQRNDPLTRTLT